LDPVTGHDATALLPIAVPPADGGGLLVLEYRRQYLDILDE